MPKRKQFLNSQRKSAKQRDTVRIPTKFGFPNPHHTLTDQLNQEKTPQTANEYLAAGVDLEEAGEKWRAGDSQKSARFFVRALENYDAGLKEFSQSFDLAYNKARLQYAVAQQPRLLQHLPGDLIDLLRAALDSHRYALELSQDNADLLFNTGQVLTSLAELISESRHHSDSAAAADPLHLFQEALEFFQRCLSVQEYQFTQSEAEASASARGSMELDDLTVPPSRGKGPESCQPDEDESDEDTWAAIVEPITRSTLLDTLLAQMETLTSVCGFLSSRGTADPSWLEQYFQNLLEDKIGFAAREAKREHEAMLVQAKFKCALADAGFSTSRLDLSTYEHELSLAYQDFNSNETDPQALCDRADAEIVFNASIQRFSQQNPGMLPHENTKVNVLRWKHLTKALDNYTTASKLPNVKNLVRIHIRRGDCELLRRGLGQDPLNYEIASKSESTLLKNAEIYYRGAGRLAKSETASDEEGEAFAKEAFAAMLLGNQHKFQDKTASAKMKVQDVILDMIEEGLLSKDDLAKQDTSWSFA